MERAEKDRKWWFLLWLFAAAVLLFPPSGQALIKTCPALLIEAVELRNLPRGTSAELINLYRMVVLPVLDEGGRREHATITFSNRNRTITVKSPMGTYTLALTDVADQAYPALGMPEVSSTPFRVYSDLTFYTGTLYRDLARTQGTFRSALRADFYLHPHLRSADDLGKSVLSYEQRGAISALIAMEALVKGGEGIKRGLVMPVGMGKTVIAAKYVAALRAYHKKTASKDATPGWKKKPKILFVVQNNQVLDRSVETFTHELDLTRVSKVYDETRGDRIPRNAQMVAITRTGYFNRREEINKLMTADPDQPWVIVFDEAHHLGKEGGEFKTILDDLHQVTDHRHRVLLLSATPWHADSELIAQYLGGNVYGGFLTDDEQESLRKGERLAEICRTQYFRAMQAGYISPIYHLNLIENLDGLNVAQLLGAEVFDKEKRTRTVTLYHDLLVDVAKRIKANKAPLMPDRGVIYVDSQKRADAYAEELSELLGEEVRQLHSGPGVDPTTLDWFSDKGQFDTPKDRKIPKYIVVVGMLKEGVDIPRINLIVLLNKYSQDMGGFRALMQALGRGGRNFSVPGFFKLDLRLLDYSLYSRWLREGIAEIMVEKRDRRGQRLNRPEGFLMFDNKVMDPVNFTLDFFKLFPRDGSFAQEFPHFDLRVFQKETLWRLHELSVSYGVRNFAGDFGAKKLILKIAAQLPASREKNQLIADLENDAVWGWGPTDGLDAKDAGSNSSSGAERIYRALHRIAALQKVTLAGKDLELANLQRTAELEKLLTQLDPKHIGPITDLAEKKLFFDPEHGAWTVIAFEAMERHLGKVSDPDGLQTLMVALAKSLPPSPARTKLLKRLNDEKDLRVSSMDGQHLNTAEVVRLQTTVGGADEVRNRGPLQRCYRAFYAIAQILTDEGADIDLTKLHEREEAGKVLALLNSKRGGIPYTAEVEQIFMDDEKGAMRVFAERTAFLGDHTFARDYGSTRTLWALVTLLPDDKERDELLKDLKDTDKWGFTAKDGARMMSKDGEKAGRLFYTALMRIAVLHNRLSPDLKVDLEKLRTREEAEKFYDYLVLGFHLPPPEEKELLAFVALAGPLVEQRAVEIGVNAYVTNFGPKRMTERLIDALNSGRAKVVPPKVSLVLRSERLSGWNINDGNMLTQGTSRRAMKSFHRAFATLVYLIEKKEGKKLRLDREADLHLLLDRAKP